MSKNQLDELLKSILPIVLGKGPSHTTMDYVASKLGISKRTLYEIFGSKDDMLREVLKYHHEIIRGHMEEIFRNNENMMAALYEIIELQNKFLQLVGPSFFSDMDEKCKHLRPHYDLKNADYNKRIEGIISLGIQQGMFRKQCDYEMNFRLLRIQLESIKRMEKYFPPEITIAQAFNSIAQGFLRNIATQKGIAYLDSRETEKENNKH